MGKSPFAEKATHTYKYPEPFDQKKEDERAAQLKALKADNPDAERRIDPEVDGENWLTVRLPRSSADVDAVADLTQSMVAGTEDGMAMLQRIARGNRGVFELLVEAWSFDAEANAANYDRLDTWAGDWVRACLADAVRQGTSRDFTTKKEPSLTTPRISPVPSPPPAEPVSA